MINKSQQHGAVASRSSSRMKREKKNRENKNALQHSFSLSLLLSLMMMMMMMTMFLFFSSFFPLLFFFSRCFLFVCVSLSSLFCFFQFVCVSLFFLSRVPTLVSLLFLLLFLFLFLFSLVCLRFASLVCGFLVFFKFILLVSSSQLILLRV